MSERVENTDEEELENIIDRKIEERVEKIKEENQALKKEIKRIKDQEEKFRSSEKQNSGRISRREFLKKTSLGAAGLTALSLSPVSALDIKSNSLSFTDGTNKYLNISNGGPVQIKNTNLEVTGNLGIGSNNPSLPLEIDGSQGIRIPVGNNIQRSSSPKEGEFRINSEEEQVEVYFSNEWKNIGSIFTAIDATGGDNVFTINDSSGIDYRVHAFTTTGSATFEIQDSGSDGLIDVFIVGGGGGGGGGAYGGGGGAGGIILKPGYDISGQNSISVAVGSGGSGGAAQSTDGSTGTDSKLGEITALGGGYGSARGGSDPAGSGGSGGGSGYNPSTGGEGLQPSSTYGGFGNDGGSQADSGCGGGGAGEVGPIGDTSSPHGSRGGNGLYQLSVDGQTYNFSKMFGTNYGEVINGEAWFAGGGSAGGSNAAYKGGKGGGGASDSSGNALAGQANTGSGGAGGGYDGSNHKDGAPGGSGIVLIRYPLEKS